MARSMESDRGSAAWMRIRRRASIAALVIAASAGPLAVAPSAATLTSPGVLRPPFTPPRTGGPQEMALITDGGHRVLEQGTLACTQAGEPLRVATTLTQGSTHATGVWSKHCKVAVTNSNGMFADWKLTLTARSGVFHAGGARLQFVYSRGQPLKQIFHGAGQIQLFSHGGSAVALGAVIPLGLVALLGFVVPFGRWRRRRMA